MNISINNPLLAPRPSLPGVGPDLSNGWREFDLLAAVVSRYQASAEHMKMIPQQPPQEHRISCHRCGNIRKRRTLCSRPNCPHTFCGRCTDKLKLEYGNEIFTNGCPVCKDLCCCSNKTVTCERKNHCYRKCPATKQVNKPTSTSPVAVKEEDDAERSSKEGTITTTETGSEKEASPADGATDAASSSSSESIANATSCLPCSTEEKQPKKKQRTSQPIHKIPDMKPMMNAGMHYPYMYPFADPAVAALAAAQHRNSAKRPLNDDLERYIAARNFVDPSMLMSDLQSMQGYSPYGYPYPPQAYQMMQGYGRLPPTDRSGQSMLMYPPPYGGLDEEMIMALQRNMVGSSSGQGVLPPQLQYLYARNALANELLARQAAAAGLAQEAAVSSNLSAAKSTTANTTGSAPSTSSATTAAPVLPLGLDKAMLEKLAAEKDNAMSLLAMVSSYNLALEQQEKPLDV